MNGSARTGQATPKPSFAGFFWRAVGMADFDGDGGTDILWQDLLSGRLSVWRMNGTDRTATLTPAPSSAGKGWRPAATADFDGDGKPDILWQNHSTGRLVLWLMNGAARTASVTPNPSSVGETWRAVGAADFNGDGKPDILWQNPTTGQLVVWYMNGATRTGSAPLKPSSVGGRWRIVAVQDMNGNGRPDIVWQEFSTGRLSVWYMNGVNRTGSAAMKPPVAGKMWRIFGNSGAWASSGISGSSAAEEPKCEEGSSSSTAEEGENPFFDLPEGLNYPYGEAYEIPFGEDPVEGEKLPGLPEGYDPVSESCIEGAGDPGPDEGSGCSALSFPALGAMLLLPLLLLTRSSR